MTSTPEPDAARPEAETTARPITEHHIPEAEAGEAELPESADAPPSTEAPVSHASAHAEQPAPAPTAPTMRELELALAALDEIAPAGAVGEVLGATAEGGAHGQAQVVAIQHASTLAGYPDWSWTVLLSRGLEGGPTVLEVALLPGETALLSPAWVPWSERLADYLAAKEAGTEPSDDDDDDFESDLEADLDDDFDDDYDVEDGDLDDADVDGDDDEDGDDEDDDDDAEWDDQSDEPDDGGSEKTGDQRNR